MKNPYKTSMEHFLSFAEENYRFSQMRMQEYGLAGRYDAAHACDAQSAAWKVMRDFIKDEFKDIEERLKKEEENANT